MQIADCLFWYQRGPSVSYDKDFYLAVNDKRTYNSSLLPLVLIKRLVQFVKGQLIRREFDWE